MNRKEYLLTCLSEECAELSLEACKSIRFGLDSYGDKSPMKVKEYTNGENMVKKFVDVYTIIKMLEQEGYVNLNFTGKEINNKMNKVDKYYNISRGIGLVD